MSSVGYNGGTTATLSYQYDNAQRLATVTGSGLSNLPATLFSPTQGQTQYGPVGLLNATLGTSPHSLAEVRGYRDPPPADGATDTVKSRVRVSYSLTLGYSGDSDVTSAADSVNGNWTYGYDGFNRLVAASMPPSNPTLAYSYAYDRFGNRWQQNLTKGTGWPVQLNFNGNNQITTAGYTYDAAGNVAMDGVNCYTYDAENRLSSVAPETSAAAPCCAPRFTPEGGT